MPIMYAQKMYIQDGNTTNSKLVVLFNTLEEKDKDIVLKISELLFEKWNMYRINIAIKKYDSSM